MTSLPSLDVEEKRGEVPSQRKRPKKIDGKDMIRHAETTDMADDLV